MPGRIYRFGGKSRMRPEGVGDAAELRAHLGGKGAGLAEMARAGVRVPPGFVLPTTWAVEFMGCSSQGERDEVRARLEEEVRGGLKWLDAQGDHAPLLSVRSGARVSMPGMMDTVLNVGLTKNAMGEWVDRLGEGAAWDCRRRQYEMYGEVVARVPGLRDHYQDSLSAADGDRTRAAREATTRCAEALVEAGRAMPDDRVVQVMDCVWAVLASWNNERARAYRRMNDVPDEWGTAVVVQTMVFGNLNDRSGSGVMFTRCPVTGETEVVGEFLPSSQGEDVVAGTSTPMPLSELDSALGSDGSLGDELGSLAEALEGTYADMQDIEFTIQDGVIYVLQTRAGKRTGRAAIRIAHDLAEEGIITRDEAVGRVTVKDYTSAVTPTVDETAAGAPQARGLPASSGVAVGRPVFTAEEAVTESKMGPVILVTEETTPDDVEGMRAAVGVLTRTGGITSHAAVVARAMNRVCVTGCPDVAVEGGYAMVGGVAVAPGAVVTVDGASGGVWVGEVPVLDGRDDPALTEVAGWAADMLGRSLVSDAGDREGTWVHVTDAFVEQGPWTPPDEGLAQGVVLSLVNPRELWSDNDDLLWDLDPMSTQDFMVDQLRALDGACEAGALDGARLVLSWYAALVAKDLGLALKGMDRVRTAQTVADVLDGGHVYVTPNFENAVMGGRWALDEVVDMMSATGAEVWVHRQPVTAVEALALVASEGGRPCR